MTLYQKIPTTSARIHPTMAVAAGGVLLLSLVATAAIVGWLPETGRAGEPSVSSPVPATAARASSASSAVLPASPAVRKVRQQNSQAGATQFASA